MGSSRCPPRASPAFNLSGILRSAAGETRTLPLGPCTLRVCARGSPWGDLVSSERTPFRCFAGNPVQSKSKFESKFQVRSWLVPPLPPPSRHPRPSQRPAPRQLLPHHPDLPVRTLRAGEQPPWGRPCRQAARTEAGVPDPVSKAPPAPASCSPYEQGKQSGAACGGSRACGRAGGAGYL